MEFCVLTSLLLTCEAAPPRASHVQYLLIKPCLLDSDPR